MDAWEYLVLTMAMDREYSQETQKELNRLGEDGWELVSVQPIADAKGPMGTKLAIVIFKQPKRGRIRA